MAGQSHSLRRTVGPHPMIGKVLLGCGIAASAWWIAMDIIGSLRYPTYSYIDQTISELSAEGAPTRVFMTVMSGIPYTALMVAFGVGIWSAAGERRAERVTGALLIGEAAWGMAGGLLFPMAMRGNESTLRNDLHAVYGIGMPIFFLLAIGFGSGLLGKRFRYFSFGTVAVALTFGLLVALQSPKVPANEPTPWLGVEERVNAYASLLWFTVLAIGLLRAHDATAMSHLQEPMMPAQLAP